MREDTCTWATPGTVRKSKTVELPPPPNERALSFPVFSFSVAFPAFIAPPPCSCNRDPPEAKPLIFRVCRSAYFARWRLAFGPAPIQSQVAPSSLTSLLCYVCVWVGVWVLALPRPSGPSMDVVVRGTLKRALGRFALVSLAYKEIHGLK
jgi:hypothetical protein